MAKFMGRAKTFAIVNSNFEIVIIKYFWLKFLRFEFDSCGWSIRRMHVWVCKGAFGHYASVTQTQTCSHPNKINNKNQNGNVISPEIQTTVYYMSSGGWGGGGRFRCSIYMYLFIFTQPSSANTNHRTAISILQHKYLLKM